MARESKLSGLSNNELRALGTKGVAAKFYSGNVGAAWNALFNPKTGRLANDKQDAPVTTKPAQPATVKTATVKAQPAIKPAGLPGRVEDYFFDSLGWDENVTIQKHHVELVVLSDTPAWNRLIRRFGLEEKLMLQEFLGAGCTLTDRAEMVRSEKRNRPFVISAETVAKFASIDSGLIQRESRFESSRYDYDLTAFYCAD